MAHAKPSRSAEGVALLRAIETQKPEAERVCDDPYARALISGGISFLLSKLVIDSGIYERLAPGAIAFVVGRERYIDDFLKACLSEGFDQIVVLGAGFDTRAYRIPGIDQTRVFEIDQSATQKVKLERLKKIFDPLPARVTFVPVDFNTQMLGERLQSSGYSEQSKTLFIWQGVTYFLTADGVDRTLAFIAEYSGPGSAVIFDYCYNDTIRDTSRGYGKLLRRSARLSGEAYLFGIDQGQVEPFLARRGFCEVRDVPLEDVKSMYFTGPNAGRTLPTGVAIVSARVTNLLGGYMGTEFRPFSSERNTMMTQEQTPVLIVGAGGAGLTLSLLLQQQGIASVLVERRPDVSWYPRARNLNFRTLEVFRGLGLEVQVLAAGTHVSQTFRKQTLASPEREEFPSIEQALQITDHPESLTPEPLFWYCPQSRLEPLLLAEAKRRGGDVRYNTELVSFTQDSQGVRATIRDRVTGATSAIQTDYMLGADGAHSRICDALGVKAEGLGVLDEHYMFVYFRADWGELIRGYEADAILIQRPSFQGFFLITDADRGMFALLTQAESTQEYTAERCRQLILDGIGKPDLAVEIVDTAHWQPAQLVAEQFGQGRVFLVGDAAHTMPPKLGLGLNTAIGSAQNLAWKLAAVLKGQAGPELLATYHAERHPVGMLASQQSLVGPAATLLTKGSDDKLLPAEKRVPVFTLIAGHRYRSQAVLAEDAGADAPAEIELLEQPEELAGQPGTRVPHLWLERGGQRISTLDLFDGHFVLLAGPAGAPWREAAPGVAAALGIELATYRLGADGDLRDLDNGWQAKLGVSPEGAVLVRPDGFVAWRSAALVPDPESRLAQVLSSLLFRSIPATRR